MSDGERPGTAGKLRRFGGGRLLGDGVVARARLKLEKSSTSMMVVDESTVTVLTVVVVVVVAVVVVAVVVVAAVVVVRAVIRNGRSVAVVVDGAAAVEVVVTRILEPTKVSTWLFPAVLFSVRGSVLPFLLFVLHAGR
jgi:hypothetical protein